MLKLYGPRAVWEKAGSVPVLKVSPGVPADNRPVVFYHGWSTDSEKQLSKALLMAAYGYTSAPLPAEKCPCILYGFRVNYNLGK